jgi:4-diphosphocytidyl-2-C-methyl-D-erythritol kinase
MKSSEILNKLSIEEANDLYLPAVKLYPKLKEYAMQDWFFSGSGSSFFKVI